MDIYAKIKLADSISDSAPQLYSFDKQPNNLSFPQGSSTLRTEGLNAVTLTDKQPREKGNLGYLNLLESERAYDGYRFGVTDDNGLYSLSLTVTSQSADRSVYGIVVYGDESAGQRPTEADYIVTGGSDSTAVHISNLNNVWAIMFKTPAPSVTVRFRGWSRPRYNACITHIEPLPQELIIDGTRLKSVESVSQICARTDEIAYGVLPGDGELEIYDYDGEIADCLTSGIIPFENARVDIFAGDNLIQSHYVFESDSEDKTIKLKLTDAVGLFEKIFFPGLRVRKSESLWHVLCEVMAIAGYDKEQVRSMCGERVYVYQKAANLTIENYLQNIIIPYPYLESGTLRETVDKICQAAMLFCYTTPDGSVKFTSARPNRPYSKSAVKIPSDRIYGTVKQSLFPKMKYTSVKVEMNAVAAKKTTVARFQAKYMRKKNSVETISGSNDFEMLFPDLALDVRRIYNGPRNSSVLYIEKSIELLLNTTFENSEVKVKASYFDDSNEERTASYESSNPADEISITLLKKAGKDDFLKQYMTNSGLKPDFKLNKNVIMGYFYDEGKVEFMLFIPLYHDSDDSSFQPRVTEHDIEFLADEYTFSDYSADFS